ncbi:MAG: DUF4290 domain-containing protein [Flavobacteriales bacterium]
MEYNSSRPDLIIPEYGRNVHNMVAYAMEVEDREERNKIAAAIISVMGQLSPHLRDLEDYNHKLWDHLYIISQFKLDVDAPYPMPEPEKLAERPRKVPYPQSELKYGHYGKNIQNIIDVCKDFEEGEEKEKLKVVIANLMKRHYMAWNQSSVVDHTIKKQLREMSNGKLELGEDVQLAHVAAPPSNQNKNNQHKKKKYSKKPYKKR